MGRVYDCGYFVDSRKAVYERAHSSPVVVGGREHDARLSVSVPIDGRQAEIHDIADDFQTVSADFV